MKKKNNGTSIQRNSEKDRVYVTGWEAQLRNLENLEQDASYDAIYYGKSIGAPV